MNATRGEASTSAAASLAFVPRKLGSGGTRGRGRGLRPGLSSSSSSTSARPRPPPQLLPHDVDFPSDTLLHATLSLSLDLAGRVDVSEAEEQQKRKVVDRLVRRRLERLAPRTVDYVTLRRVTPGDESSCGGDEGQTLVEVSTARSEQGRRASAIVLIKTFPLLPVYHPLPLPADSKAARRQVHRQQGDPSRSPWSPPPPSLNKRHLLAPPDLARAGGRLA